MRKRWIGLIVTILLISVLGLLYAHKAERLFMSHETAVHETIAHILNRNQQQLPQEPVDLALLHQTSTTTLAEVATWQIQNVELANTTSQLRAILDDDPIYRLKADLQITYSDGSQATLAWESWRYGLVFGSRVLSLGSGPPGYITAVTYK